MSKNFNTILEIKEIDTNITLFKRHDKVENETRVFGKCDAQCLHFSIVLDGQTNYKSELSSYSNSVKKNETSITLENQEEGRGFLSKNIDFKKIGLLIKNDFCDQYLISKLKEQDTIKKDYEQSKTTILSKHKTNTKTAILAKEIFHSPFTGDLNDIYLQSKVYELIHTEFKNLLDSQEHRTDSHIKFSDEDIQRLHYGKKLIQEEKQYLSLKELSRAIALNEYKLKYGFKKIFNISFGTMVLNEKMNEAKRLLESSELNINEISQVIGYKYPSNFTGAFKKHFRINPTDIMKNRKYYY